MLAYIGLGSNLQNPKMQIENALSALSEVDGIELKSVSSFYESKPLLDMPGPNYLNAVCKINTQLGAIDLLDTCQAIENNQKRIIENEIRFLVLSFTSDWLFPTKDSREIVSLLNSIGSNVSFAEVVSDRGHDSFLLDEPQFFRVCEGFLKGIK